MADVFLCKRGALDARSRRELRKAGVVVVEVEDPDACQFIRASEVLSGDDMLWAALEALRNSVTPGHLLVVPKRHVPDALADPDVTADTMQVAATVAERDCNIITSAGPNATQTVQHLHLHVVPRREGDGLALPWTAPASPPASPGGGEGLPEITDAVLSQWEESARADHEAGRTWSINPLAILAVVQRLRAAPPPPGGDGAREARERLARLADAAAEGQPGAFGSVYAMKSGSGPHRLRALAADLREVLASGGVPYDDAPDGTYVVDTLDGEQVVHVVPASAEAVDEKEDAAIRRSARLALLTELADFFMDRDGPGYVVEELCRRRESLRALLSGGGESRG